MDNTCLFCRFAQDREKEFVYADDRVMVFPDIHPKRATHLLIVPREHVHDVIALTDDTLWAHVRTVIAHLVKQNGLEGKGIEIRINASGAQEINHLHIHLLSNAPSM
jgi:histidine triad (HIT) family protein